MRFSELRKYVEQLMAGGGGGGAVPDLSDSNNEINILNMADFGSGLDVDGLLPGSVTIRLRDEMIEWNNTSGVLDPAKGYLVVASYVLGDPDVDSGGLDLVHPNYPDSGGMVRVEDFNGPATIDHAGLRSTIMPVGLDLIVALNTAGTRLSNIQLYPLG